ADVPTFNLAWELQRPGWFDGITCYNNLSLTLPRGGHPGLRESWQNVTGCSFAKGRMFTYVDWIAGRNMWFAGGPGVGIHEPGGDGWRSRLNINMGFFFRGRTHDERLPGTPGHRPAPAGFDPGAGVLSGRGAGAAAGGTVVHCAGLDRGDVHRRPVLGGRRGGLVHDPDGGGLPGI